MRTLLLVGIAVAMGVGSLKFLPTESEPNALAVTEDSSRTYVLPRREQPVLPMPICTLIVDADLAANARLYRFATAAERSRYRREHCRLAPRYMTVGSAEGDVARLAADHPAVYAPICASLVQHGAGPAALASVTRQQLQRITRRACLAGLRNGAITCGPNGFADGKVDEARFEAIVSRVSDDIEVSCHEAARLPGAEEGPAGRRPRWGVAIVAHGFSSGFGDTSGAYRTGQIAAYLVGWAMAGAGLSALIGLRQREEFEW